MQIWIFDFSSWLTWASIGIGIVVTVSILWLSHWLLARRRPALADEGTMPWGDLLELLKVSQGAAGELPEAWNNLPSDQLLQLLLGQLRERAALTGDGLGQAAPFDFDDANYLKFGSQRRASRRRWFNPTEVRITTGFNEKSLKGLIVNRSEGGLGILTDSEHAIGAVLFITPAEAPKSLPAVTVAVRHARPAGKLWIIGCQYTEEIPWNVKVWFG